MAKSFYRLEPARKAGLLPAVGEWFRRSHTGWKWLLIVLPLQGVSAWTNVEGMKLALEPWVALIMGLGLQGLALYVGIGLINATEEDRPAWKRALWPILGISVFFSFAGFTSLYAADLERRTLPLKQRDDLRDQALDLSAKVDEGRRLAMSAYQNRIDYARDVLTQVRARQQSGGYPDPVAAEKAVAEWNGRIAAAEGARSEWEEFAFDAQAPLLAGTNGEGFSQLQQAYGRLGNLMGRLRKDEAESFQMPSPPLPTVNASDSVGRQDLIGHATAQIFTVPGLFWLVMAIFLEAIPFWVAHANPAAVALRDEEEVDWRPEELDRELAREVARVNGMVRPVHMIATASLRDVEEQSARTDPIVQELRESYVETLRLKRLERDAETRRKRLHLLIEHGRERNVPPEVLQRIVEEDFNEMLKEFGIEDLRQERVREDRRETVLGEQPT